eukprot:8074501-Pyramimonas_sp.AAC.1
MIELDSVGSLHEQGSGPPSERIRILFRPGSEVPGAPRSAALKGHARPAGAAAHPMDPRTPFAKRFGRSPNIPPHNFSGLFPGLVVLAHVCHELPTTI